MLDNFANLVNNYKTKYKLFIFSIIRYSQTTIIVSKVIILISLIDIIVFILLLKKRNKLFKTTKIAFICRGKNKLSKIKTTINNNKNNNIEILS